MNRVFPTFSGFLSLFIPGLFFIYQGLLTDLLADEGPKNEAGIEITVKETSMVQSSRIFLQDIADIKADRFLKETLGKIDFGFSPKPGKIKFIDKRKILSVIQRERYLPEDFIITCPDRVYVKRQSEQISALDIQKYVEQRLSEVFRNKDFRLISFNVRGLEPYPSGEILFFTGSEDMVDKNGKLSLFVDIVINGKKTDRVSVTGFVDVRALVQKGDIVSLVAQHETLLIVTKGICKEDGFENDVIKIENLNSGKIIRGKIKEKSRVEVLY